MIAAGWWRMADAHLAWAKAAPRGAAAKLDVAAQYYRLAIPEYRKRAQAGELVGAEVGAVQQLEAALAEAIALRRK